VDTLAMSLNGPAKYIHLGPLTISIPNLIMFCIIIFLFTIPFLSGMLKIRRRPVAMEDARHQNEIDTLTLIAKWSHIVNSTMLAALTVVGASGLFMASRGLNWLYTSNVSRYVHAVHFWSVQILFIAIILHFIGNFWRAKWRSRAFAMWASGTITFFTCMFTAFTGGVVASNLNSQWIALQSKNVFNSLGVGSLFNTLNVGQMLTVHVAIFPVVIGSLVLWHVALVRGRSFRSPWKRNTISKGPK
jgi:hypothetical protein